MTKISKIRPAGANHQVVTVDKSGERYCYRREPCAECPWRKDAPIGAFPAEAFRISATTAYDKAGNSFACHMSGLQQPTTCAGFLLSGADHNFGVRMRRIAGDIKPGSVTSPVALYESYREMAEANGVDPDDPALDQCRDNS